MNSGKQRHEREQIIHQELHKNTQGTTTQTIQRYINVPQTTKCTH